MPRLTIDGIVADVANGLTVLEAASELGIEIPTLCNDPRLEPIGGCRLCIVDSTRTQRPVTACNTEAVDGDVIETATPGIEALRRTLLEGLARNYAPSDETVLPTNEFINLVTKYGIADQLGMDADFGGVTSVDDAHPYIRVDMGRCITCFRCVRICAEVQGQFVWEVWGRGGETRIVADSGGALADSSCVSCGACADTCPSGAIIDKSLVGVAGEVTWTRTTCEYCGTGCELYAGTSGGSLVAARPVVDAPSSKGHLCVKGRYAHAYVSASDRVTTPLIREERGAEWREASWSEAIAYAARKLEEIRAERGPGAVGVLGSSRGTNEENYLAQKFARLVIGTNNVDCCARVCHAPTAAAMAMILGTGAATNSFDDIELANAFLVVGANSLENHPVVGARIRQRVLAGAGLVVIDPRRTELAEMATVHLAPEPGTDIPLMNAIAAAVIEAGGVDEDFVTNRVEGLDAFCRHVLEWTPKRAEAVTRVPAGLIREAALLYAETDPAMAFHGLGLTEHTQGTEAVMAIVNLALLTGNVGKPGSGVNPLRGQNNVQGSAHMGCEPTRLTGYVPIDKAKDLTESVWGAPIPIAPGLDMLKMLDRAQVGELKALYCIGYDVAMSTSDADNTARALSQIELVIVQDLFVNETASEFGHVFFPVASVFERDGTFMNSERRVQRVRKSLEPPGDARPDWEITRALASEMGHGEQFDFSDPSEIWEEIRKVWRAGTGISYERLEAGGIQWPCPDESSPGTRILHVDEFAGGPTAELRRLEYIESEEVATAEFPLILTTGRTLFAFNAATMTSRTPNLELRPTDTLDISPDDASVRSLADGDRAVVRSRHGEVVLPVRIDDRVKAGEVFATFHDPAVMVNRVVSPGRDRFASTPEYKRTAVDVSAAIR